jgi:RimJ/RimL family protein N-acetyltransferase
MYDLTIDAFPPDRLEAIVHWRNDPAVNTYLRQGLRTLAEVQAWYTTYFSRAENKLCAVYADKTLIGYGTLEHMDTTHRSCERGIVIGNADYWNTGLGTRVVQRLTALALTTYHLRRVYAVIQGGNRASMRCFEKAGSSMKAHAARHGIAMGHFSTSMTMRCSRRNGAHKMLLRDAGQSQSARRIAGEAGGLHNARSERNVSTTLSCVSPTTIIHSYQGFPPLYYPIEVDTCSV